jgi:hypothetical protein
MKLIPTIIGTTIFAIVFIILVRFFNIETIYVDVYPVPTYKECQVIQKEFTNFNVEFIFWNEKTLHLKVRAKSIDTLVSHLPGYHITSRIRNNNVSLRRNNENP